MKRIVSAFQFLKTYMVLTIGFLFDFLKLDKATRSASIMPRSAIRIHVNHYDEHSDDESSIRHSLDSSRNSKKSANDDDNNNESNVTPTLNNSSIPRISPDIVVNSTPLNHYDQNGLSIRKYRRDLIKSR